VPGLLLGFSLRTSLKVVVSKVPDVDVTVDAEELKKAVQEAENMDRPVKRLVKLLQDVASRPLRGSKRLHFAFGASPEALLRDASGAMSGLQTSIGTIPADLVVSSVGYVADTPDPALAPLASSGSFLQNSRGRIRKGLYVTGWAKRGSSGIVGTNKFCAAETVQSFLLDSLVPTKCGMPPPLPSTALSREQMEKIEIKEKEKGGRFTRLEDMIKALD
jgi:ferredoxin--NADP+ reductase